MNAIEFNATTAAASAQSFEERVAIEVIRKQAQLEELART